MPYYPFPIPHPQFPIPHALLPIPIMTLTTSPAILSEDQALSLVEKAVKQSEAEAVFVSLSTGEESLSRFSENQISQNISKTVFSLNITSYFGNKSASAAVTDFDEDAIAQTVKRSQELAKIAPADPEWMPLLPPQAYDLPAPAFDEATAAASPLERAEMVRQTCAIASQAGANASGTLSAEASLYAIASSTGLRACNSSNADRRELNCSMGGVLPRWCRRWRI